MSRVIFNEQTGRMEVMPDPRIDKLIDRRPTAINPDNFPRGRGPYGGMNCPALNEEVLLADNKWIPAQDLKVGDKVATHLGSNKVTHIDVLKDRVKKEVVFSDNDQEESIVTSDSHPYYVQNEEGFVEVKDLKVGDQVGNFKVKEIKDADKGSVVHISIDEAQTYYLKAGDKKVLSHNKSIRPPKPPEEQTIEGIPISQLPYNPRIPQIGPKLPPNILAGIGNIPGLNLDFSKLPGVKPGSLGGVMEFSEARKRAIMTGTKMPNIEDYDIPGLGPRSSDISTDIALPEGGMVGTLGGPGYGEFPLGTAGPRVDPSDPNYIPPPANRPTIQAPAMPAPPAPAPYTGAGYDAFGEQPFVSSVNRVESGLDPLTKQLLFGLDGKGGFIPGAMRAAEKVFFDDEGNPVVIEEKVAGLSPDQLRAQELAREGVGIQDSYLQNAQDAYNRGVSALEEGLGRARGFAEQGLDATRTGLGSLESGLSQQEMISKGATGDFGRRLAGVGRMALGSTGEFGGRLGESENLLRGTVGGYDQGLTGQFYNPFEQQVVQQTISDILEQGDKAEVAARAQDIARGGESAFGSRARLGAAERREALGRGLGEAVSGIRAGGFGEAQRLGLGEFARQRAAERAASSGLANLAGSRLASQQQLGGTLRGLSADQLAAQQNLASGLGSIGAQRMAGQQQLASSLGGLSNLEAQIGQQQQQAQFGLGQSMQNLGTQAQAARAADVSQLYGIGQQQQALEQQRLDAQRRNQLQAQQAPLAQYQSLMPFVGMAPAGQQMTTTAFTPPPSPLQAGLATGLGAFGAFGNFMNQGQRAV